MAPRSDAPVRAILGPTNTGKTHLAIERMCGHSSGVIGFPLRLLAREVYDRVVAIKGEKQVALLTGEERIVPPTARYFLCTAESMPVASSDAHDGDLAPAVTSNADFYIVTKNAGGDPQIHPQDWHLGVDGEVDPVTAHGANGFEGTGHELIELPVVDDQRTVRAHRHRDRRTER